MLLETLEMTANTTLALPLCLCVHPQPPHRRHFPFMLHPCLHVPPPFIHAPPLSSCPALLAHLLSLGILPLRLQPAGQCKLSPATLTFDQAVINRVTINFSGMIAIAQGT